MNMDKLMKIILKECPELEKFFEEERRARLKEAVIYYFVDLAKINTKNLGDLQRYLLADEQTDRTKCLLQAVNLMLRHVLEAQKLLEELEVKINSLSGAVEEVSKELKLEDGPPEAADDGQP